MCKKDTEIICIYYNQYESVYCAVQKQSLNEIYINLSSKCGTAECVNIAAAQKMDYVWSAQVTMLPALLCSVVLCCRVSCCVVFCS